MPKVLMKEKVKAALKDSGFDLVGITTAEPLSEEARHLEQALASGFGGEMDYLGRNAARRSCPGEFLSGARSVVVAAAAYEPAGAHGPVASYALHGDYHRVFRAALARGVEAIEALEPAARCRMAVDSSPLLERALARRAGLGRIGYSTNLITPRFGPFVLLGVIVTTLVLEPDEPREGPSCSECGRCLEACPTGALVAPYRLDARRCISYLTIEKKGPFAPPEGEAIGGWVFGCDLCLSACAAGPLSGGMAQPRGLLRLHLNLRNPDLPGLLDRCESGFKRSFRETALFRCGRSRIIRNLLFAARNQGHPWAGARARRHLRGGTLASREAARRAVEAEES